MKTIIFLLLFSTLALAEAPETLSWQPSPSIEVQEYRLYWSTNYNAPKPWTLINTVPVGALSCNGSTNTVGINYYYLTAWNPWNESPPTRVVFVSQSPINPKVHKQ